MLCVSITNLFWHKEGEQVQGTLFKAAIALLAGFLQWNGLFLFFITNKINADINASSYKNKM